MKTDIHPTYFPQAKVICVCGNKFATGSTQEEIRIELCSNCHPFYTGKQKLVDSARRVEKFQERGAKKVTTVRGGRKQKLAKRVARREEKKAKTPEEKKLAEELKRRIRASK